VHQPVDVQLFITLDELYIDGLVHISDLGQDYFKFDQHKHQLVGERTGVKYQLAGRVRVKVVRVNLEAAKIDFVLVNPPEAHLAPDQGKQNATPPKLRDYDKKMKKLESERSTKPKVPNTNRPPKDRGGKGKGKKAKKP